MPSPHAYAAAVGLAVRLAVALVVPALVVGDIGCRASPSGGPSAPPGVSPPGTSETACPDGDTPCIPVGLDAYRRLGPPPLRSHWRADVHAQHLRPRRGQRGRRREPLPARGRARRRRRPRRRRHGRRSRSSAPTTGTAAPGTSSSTAPPTSSADTATATPGLRRPRVDLPAGRAFPRRSALTYAMTQGADVSWVPMGFTRSFTSDARPTPTTAPATSSTRSTIPGPPISRRSSRGRGRSGRRRVAILAAAGPTSRQRARGSRPVGHGDAAGERAVPMVDLAGPATVRVCGSSFRSPPAQAALEAAHAAHHLGRRASRRSTRRCRCCSAPARSSTAPAPSTS